MDFGKFFFIATRSKKTDPKICFPVTTRKSFPFRSTCHISSHSSLLAQKAISFASTQPQGQQNGLIIRIRCTVTDIVQCRYGTDLGLAFSCIFDSFLFPRFFTLTDKINCRNNVRITLALRSCIKTLSSGSLPRDSGHRSPCPGNWDAARPDSIPADAAPA